MKINARESDEFAALDRLIAHAKRDSDQARRVANFLLCWWNADTMGAWDIRQIWSLDEGIEKDVMTVFRFMSRTVGVYPDAYGYHDDFMEIIQLHRDAKACLEL